MKESSEQKIDELSQDRIEAIKELIKKLNLDPNEFLQNHGRPKLHILNEALTHTSADFKISHERLEFLGDAVLRLAASEFIDRKYPNMDVGERSALRSQLVSDNWLAEVGKNIKILKFVILGKKSLKDVSSHMTVQAEITEALIGAIYECKGSINDIYNWLLPYWEEKTLTVLADPHRQNYKSGLQEWSQAQGKNLPIYECKEVSSKHGDQRRFLCKVFVEKIEISQGWGGSIKEAEKSAAQYALEKINKI